MNQEGAEFYLAWFSQSVWNSKQIFVSVYFYIIYMAYDVMSEIKKTSVLSIICRFVCRSILALTYYYSDFDSGVVPVMCHDDSFLLLSYCVCNLPVMLLI